MLTPRRNLLPLAGLVVCAIAFLSYPTFFVRFPETRDVPWANWLLFAIGLSLASSGIRRAFRFSRGRVLAPLLGAGSLAFLGLFVFMTEVASRDLPPAANAPAAGAKAPDFTLPDAAGKPVALADLLRPKGTGGPGSWLLLIFYRGSW